jgi:acetyl-CoA carboxylase carboxyltransferase component
MILAGCLDVNSSKKAARFTRFAIVLIFRYWFWWMYRVFTGNGSRMERDYRSRCEIVYALSEATVPSNCNHP